MPSSRARYSFDEGTCSSPMRLTCTPASTPIFLVDSGSGFGWPSVMGVVVATAAAAPSVSPCSAEASQPLSTTHHDGPRFNEWTIMESVEERSSTLTPVPACACCSGAVEAPTISWIAMLCRCAPAWPAGVGGERRTGLSDNVPDAAEDCGPCAYGEYVYAAYGGASAGW